MNNFIRFHERKFDEFISMNNQECKVISKLVNVNSNEPALPSF